MHYTYLPLPGAAELNSYMLDEVYSGISERDAFALRIHNVTGTAEAMDGYGTWHELNEFMVLEHSCRCESELASDLHTLFTHPNNRKAIS